MKRPNLSNGSLSAETGSKIPGLLMEMLKGGLAILWRSFVYAREMKTDGWEFSVKAKTLYEAGLSEIDLRWLISCGYADFAPDPERCGSQRQSREEIDPGDKNNGYFILTKSGAGLALQVLSQKSQLSSPPPSDTGKCKQTVPSSNGGLDEPRLARQMPSWDPEKKELRLGTRVIKQFRWAAMNQETILMAFEEDGWPARIDDPLPQKPNYDPKNRLHDTIKCLNRNHKERLIRFFGDGTGEGIRWEFLDPSCCDP
jgi:hypothetical protein